MKQAKFNNNNPTPSASFYKNKKILVTGGAGFVGTNLIFRLLNSGAKITAIYHIKKPRIENSRINYIKANLIIADDCKKICSGQELVFMCAANTSGAAVIQNNPLAHVTPNVVMNTLMMEAAHKARVKKFLFISSNTVYPPFDHPVKESEAFLGEPFEKYFPVAWMKRFGEILGEMYTSKIKNPLTVVVVRPANIYGPYDDFNWETSHVIPALIRKVVERHDPVEVWGDGKDIKDLIYVEDFVEGLLSAMAKISKFQPINIASGKGVSINDVLKMIIKLENAHNLKIKYNKTKPTMIKKRLLNINLAKSILNFEAKTSLEEGIGETIKWYQENKI